MIKKLFGGTAIAAVSVMLLISFSSVADPEECKKNGHFACEPSPN